MTTRVKMMLTNSELKDENVRLRYKLNNQKRKSKILYYKYRDLYDRFWAGYDFMVEHFNKDDNLSHDEEPFYIKEQYDTTLPFK